MSNFKLNNATTLRAITAQALKATAHHEVEKKQKKDKPKAKRPKLTPIERTMRGIRKAMEAHTTKGFTVSAEQPDKMSSAYAVISIYPCTGAAADSNVQKQKRAPLTRYVFYPSVTDPTRLGSIAIYGNDAESQARQLRYSRHIFGLDIARVSVEYGLRPFVDVTVRQR